MDQMSLFDGDKEKKLRLIEGDGKEDIRRGHKVHISKYIETRYESIEDLFMGFNELRAISFSYDIKFIDKLMKMVDYGEIILGARFMVRRDDDLHKLVGEAYCLLEAMTLSESAADALRGKKDLLRKMSEGDLLVRSPKQVIDHRKLYLLKADDGRKRVIKGSANMTRSAWDGNQLEVYEVDDSEEGYDAYLKDFKTAWDLASDIGEDMVDMKKTDNPAKDIPLIKEALRTREAIVLEKKPEDEESYLESKFLMDLDKKLKKNKALLVGVRPEAKDGKIEVRADKVKIISKNARNLEIKENGQSENRSSYPTLTFNYDTKDAFINDQILDLKPSYEEVRKDISLLFDAMDNYEKDFIGNTKKLRESHYKLINILFSSPFNAKLRCVAYSQNIPTSSLPLYCLITSVGSNTGKTFMTKLILKLMSGKAPRVFDVKSIPSKDINLLIQSFKGMPIFIDEIDGHYYSRIKTNIKNSQMCERRQLEEEPLIIFAANRINNPEEPERKRMPFISYDANLKSDIDATSYMGKSGKILAEANNGLYREYLRRMLDEVANLIDYMFTSKDRDDGYYPDIINISSRVLMEIFEDFDFDLPDYVREFNWNDDLSYHAKYISDDAIEGIRKMWKINPKNFIIQADVVTIESGKDSGSKRTLNSWANSLPPEFSASYSENMDKSTLTLDRAELEKRLGFRLTWYNKVFGKK